MEEEIEELRLACKRIGPEAIDDGLAVIVLEDTALRTPEIAQVLMDWPMRQVIEAEGHQFRLISYRDPVLKKMGWDELWAEAKVNPLLIVLTVDRTVQLARQLPRTAEEVLSLEDTIAFHRDSALQKAENLLCIEANERHTGISSPLGKNRLAKGDFVRQPVP